MEYFDKRYHQPGTPPGTLKSAAMAGSTSLAIHLFDYSETTFSHIEDANPAQCREYINRDNVTWVHVEGHPTEQSIRELGEIFGLHKLALEDVLNIGQRPKVDEYDDQLFVVVNLPSVTGADFSVQQACFFLGKHYVVSFCSTDFSLFQPVVKRLNEPASRLRKNSADFLLYSLLDIVIDQGFPVLETLGWQLEALEEQILKSVGRDTLERIHTIKRELILLRRMLWPQREVINHLLHGDHGSISEGTMIYLRDCYDHTIQVMDLLETYRDMSGSMLDIYLSSVSNRMNDVMRVLTVIATIFIPLTFIVGVYGMNFDPNAGKWNMPELGWEYGYPLIWLLMISCVGVMVYVFRRKGWF
ncbi:magnesium/cobalt transporter CorA [Alteromonas sp. D210916BOD_24]|uniref:magnesium/cobalt transporter CorA n=1 Tax=Alteromonas sp. D210916BOD_24 TaxID=3157618 RepID=UPI00399D2FAF